MVDVYQSNKDTEILDDSNKDTTGIVTFKNGAVRKPPDIVL